MHSMADGLGGKYAVGKMAEIMITCKEAIFKIQEEVYNASIDLVSMENVPAVCTSSSTCFGDPIKTMPEKVLPINRTTSLPTPLEPKNVRDPSLRKIYENLMDLEGVGRLEWLKVFMYMSSYMRILRPVARGDWDEPKKFVNRQTITLDGPYPGIPSDLITGDNKPPHFEKNDRKSSTDSVPQPPKVSVKNMELEGSGDDPGDFSFTTRTGPYRPSRYDPRVICECLQAVERSSSYSGTRRKSLAESIRLKYLKKYDYCVE